MPRNYTLTLSLRALRERERFYSALDLQLDGERDPAGGNASLALWETLGEGCGESPEAPTAWTRAQARRFTVSVARLRVRVRAGRESSEPR